MPQQIPVNRIASMPQGMNDVELRARMDLFMVELARIKELLAKIEENTRVKP